MEMEVTDVKESCRTGNPKSVVYTSELLLSLLTSFLTTVSVTTISKPIGLF